LLRIWGGSNRTPSSDRDFEMVAANDDIGYLTLNSWQMLTFDTMYVELLVIATLGFVFSLVLGEIKRMLIRWKTDA
jgi:ABC-type nitrate/sulfonate/bicarbonate transport system permease component